MFENSGKEHGNNITLTLQPNGDIIATLSSLVNREELLQEVAEEENRGDYRDFLKVFDLSEDLIANGYFDFLWDEEKLNYGMLTGCELIIGEDVDVLDCGHKVVRGRIWWHERYMLEDAVESLLSPDGLRLVKGGEANEDAPADGPVTCPWCGRVTEE